MVDPLAWEHIAGATLGGIVTIGFGTLMISMGAKLCTSAVGCIAGAMLIFPGVLAIPAGGALIYTGFKFTQKYLDEIFVVTP